MPTEPQPRSKLISAMAYAVDSLCTQSLLDCSGAIKALLACDDRIWDELGDVTIERLNEGMGITRP